MNKNISVVSGKLTKDIDFKSVKGDKKIAEFNLAVNTKKEELLLIPVSAWNGLAELANKHLKKGTHVTVTGNLKQNSYEDSNNVMHYCFSLVAKNLEFLTES